MNQLSHSLGIYQTIRERIIALEADIDEAHDLALKAAETDATKRAMVTFGKAFGLALYSFDRRQAATRGNTHGN